METKHCPKCGEVKPCASFYRDSSKADGLSSQCRPCKKQAVANRYQAKQEALRQYRRDYYGTNREAERAYQSEYYRQNKAAFAAASVARKRHIRRATPPWANLAAIRGIYETCPEGHHVDHVIPLRGELVSGLHVPENLQHLPAEANLAKSNAFEVC